jgi:hypothetical protein
MGNGDRGKLGTEQQLENVHGDEELVDDNEDCARG